jgi:hypothetical protein
MKMVLIRINKQYQLLQQEAEVVMVAVTVVMVIKVAVTVAVTVAEAVDVSSQEHLFNYQVVQ